MSTVLCTSIKLYQGITHFQSERRAGYIRGGGGGPNIFVLFGDTDDGSENRISRGIFKLMRIFLLSN